MKINFAHGAILLLSVFSMVACSTGPAMQMDDYSEPVFPADKILFEDATAESASNVYDPWGGMNRRIYNFNYHFDKNVFLPVTRGYQTVTPDFAEEGVSNFFDNLRDVNTFLNSVLQLSPKKSAQSLGRVVVNSTIGLLGLIDVATFFGIDRPIEDFGQTMGRWGVGAGPYLVVPVLGPSSLRDGIGLIPDTMVNSYLKEEIFGDDGGALAASVLDAISVRSKVKFRYYETGSTFEYETVRWLWTTKRELDIAK
jgi:phospholipid-binding lipoprotein MlaA